MPNGQALGPRDADLILRDGTTALTGDETLTFTVNDEMFKQGLTAYVYIPATPTGTAPELEVTVKATDAGHEVEVTHTDHITDTVIPGGLSAYGATLALPVPWTGSVNYNVTLNMVNVADEDFGNVEVWIGLPSRAVVPNA